MAFQFSIRMGRGYERYFPSTAEGKRTWDITVLGPNGNLIRARLGMTKGGILSSAITQLCSSLEIELNNLYETFNVSCWDEFNSIGPFRIAKDGTVTATRAPAVVAPAPAVVAPAPAVVAPASGAGGEPEWGMDEDEDDDDEDWSPEDERRLQQLEQRKDHPLTVEDCFNMMEREMDDGLWDDELVDELVFDPEAPAFVPTVVKE